MTDNFALQNNDVIQLLLGDNYKKKEQTILSGEDISLGMILGEVKYAAGAVVADGGNTGNGTVTVFALAAVGLPTVGDYILTCNTAVANGGIFTLVDPNGVTIDDSITIAAGPGGTVVFTGTGITFTITDGGTDFVVADFFTITVDAGSGKLKQVVSTSIDGSQFPLYVAMSDIDATGGDIVRSVIAAGKVNLDKMVFAGVETIDTKVQNKTYYEYLREVGILVLTSDPDLTSFDNQ